MHSTESLKPLHPFYLIISKTSLNGIWDLFTWNHTFSQNLFLNFSETFRHCKFDRKILEVIWMYTCQTPERTVFHMVIKFFDSNFVKKLNQRCDFFEIQNQNTRDPPFTLFIFLGRRCCF